MDTLPGAPQFWSSDDVRTWITECSHEYSLNLKTEQIALFSMNGKALLTLTRDDFCDRAPGVGDVIFNVLRHLAESAYALPTSYARYWAPCWDMGHVIAVTPQRPPVRQSDNPLMQAPTPPPVSPTARAPSACARSHIPNPAFGAMQHAAVTNGNGINSREDSALTRLLRDVDRNTQRQNEQPTYTPVPSSPTLNYACTKAPVSPPMVYSPIVKWHPPYESHTCDDSLPHTDSLDGKAHEIPAVNVHTTPPTWIKQEMCPPGKVESPKSFDTVDSTRLPPKKRHLRCESTPEMNVVTNNMTTMSRSLTPDPDREEASNIPPNNDPQNANKLLWEYISELLQTPKRERPVRWLDKTSLTFRITDPGGLAVMWGQQKQKENMTYEKLSRALRYYYPMNIICKVHGKKLTYRFTTPPTKIKKGIRGAKPGVPHKRRKVDPNKSAASKKIVPKTEEDSDILDLSVKTPQGSTGKQTIEKRKQLSSQISRGSACPEPDAAASQISEPKTTDDFPPVSHEADVEDNCLDLRSTHYRPTTTPEGSGDASSCHGTPRSPTLNKLNGCEIHSRLSLEFEAGAFFQSDRSAFSVVQPTPSSASGSHGFGSTFTDNRDRDFTIFAL